MKSLYLEHSYGPQVRIFNDLIINTRLTELSQAETIQPRFNSILSDIYNQLYTHILHQEWPSDTITSATRMSTQHPTALLSSEILRALQKSVVVDLARAGMVPSHILFDLLCNLAHPEGLRQDHIYASRVSNANGQVTGTDFSGSKIGGDIDNAIVFIPDPMGATGSSMAKAVEHYKKDVDGHAKKYVTINLIVTPEYLKKMTTEHPDVVIYAARVDRGLSPQEVLTSPLGEHWEKEVGLNEQDYIVPGAGGVGEIINNSFV